MRIYKKKKKCISENDFRKLCSGYSANTIGMHKDEYGDNDVVFYFVCCTFLRPIALDKQKIKKKQFMELICNSNESEREKNKHTQMLVPFMNVQVFFCGCHLGLLHLFFFTLSTCFCLTKKKNQIMLVVVTISR